MSYFLNICSICLKNSTNLILIKSRDPNGTTIVDKLKYILSALEFDSNIPKYICVECGDILRYDNEFKQKCLHNITTYEKYAQQVTTIHGSYKYLSVVAHPYFGHEKLEKCDTNISGLQSEINTDIVKIEEIFIKEESNEALVLDDKLESLLREIKEENPELEDTCNKNVIADENFSESDENKQYKCHLCHKIYFTKIKFESHIRAHSIVTKRHKPTHTNKKPHTCKICKKSFGKLYCLKVHHSIHTGEKPYTCEVCNKSFKQLNVLKQHKLLHTGEKPFNCEVCKASFRRLYTLEQHKLLHTGEKPFDCEVCNKSFTQLSNLKRHELIHTNEKPFTCEVCNKSFRHSQGFKQHKLIHSGEKPFTCEVCNLSVRLLATLKKHKLIHTDEKPYTCEVCNKSFRHLSYMNQHKLIHTGGKS